MSIKNEKYRSRRQWKMTFCMPNYLKKDQKCKDEWENILTIWNIISQGRNEEMCSRVKSSEKLLPRKNYIAPNEVGQLTVVSQYLKSRKICSLWQESFEKCWFLSLESMNFMLHNIFPFFEQCALTRATMRVRFWSKIYTLTLRQEKLVGVGGNI